MKQVILRKLLPLSRDRNLLIWCDSLKHENW